MERDNRNMGRYRRRACCIIVLLLASVCGAVNDKKFGADVILDGDEAKLWQYNGVYYITFRASSSLAANYNFVWPVDDGTSGQQLTSDGSGVLSWVDPGGAGGAGDISDVWGVSNGNVNALTAASGDTLDATNADSTIPWEVDTTAAPTTEGRAIWDSDDDILAIGDGTGTDYVAYGASDGDALAGDSATAFFDAGEVEVTRGGTGAVTLTDGGVLLGSGTGAITPMAVLADGEFIVGDGTTDPVAESGNTARTSLGLGTGDSPTFAGITAAGATLNGDVHFDATTEAGRDWQWDASEESFVGLDNAIWGQGNTAALPDVWHLWDGDSWETKARAASTPWNIGDDTTGFDVKWTDDSGGTFTLDYADQEGFFNGVDMRFGDSDYLYYGTGYDVETSFNSGENRFDFDASQNDTMISLDAGTNYIRLDSKVYALDKIFFTQVDEKEYIDSLTDGELDVEATTSINARINGTEQVQFFDGSIKPTTDNDIDLGGSSNEFKDLYIDGTANIDSLVADTADINAGTIDGVTIGASAAPTVTDLGSVATCDINAGTIDGTTIGQTTPAVIRGTRIEVDGATSYIDVSGSDMTFTDPTAGTLTLTELSCPPMVDVTGTAVAEGYNNITSFNNKVQIKWIEITTSSTDWTFTVYEDDDAPGAHAREIVSNRSGNYNIYWDYPYEDADASSEFHYNFTDDSGANTHDIRVMGYRLR